MLVWLTRFESAVAALAYTAVALLLISDVLGREIFGEAVFGAQKMAVYAAIVAGFLGLALATGAGAHLRPALLDGLFARRNDTLIWRLSNAVSALIYLVLAIVAIQFVISSMQAQDKAAVLYWVLWPIQLVIPYALFSCALRHGLYAVYPSLRPQADEGATGHGVAL